MTLLRFAAFLLLLNAALAAQVVTVINTRGREPSSLEDVVIGGRTVGCVGAEGGATGSDRESGPPQIQVTFSTPDSPVLRADGHIDFEVVITNRTKQAFLLPQSLDASDIADPGNLLEFHQEAGINFFLERPGSQSTFFDAGVVLYGKKSKPSTMLRLEPGDSARILGTALVYVAPVGVLYSSLDGSVPDRFLGHARMYAYFGMHSAGVTSTTRKECDGYMQVSRTVASYKSSNWIDVEVVK
jgi:hypothetical protein